MTPAREMEMLFQHATKADRVSGPGRIHGTQSLGSSCSRFTRFGQGRAANKGGEIRQATQRVARGILAAFKLRNNRTSRTGPTAQEQTGWTGQAGQNAKAGRDNLNSGRGRELESLMQSVQLLAGAAFRHKDELVQSRSSPCRSPIKARRHRDPYMNRMHNLLHLRRGLGTTKVTAFLMRPAKAERQPLLRVVEGGSLPQGNGKRFFRGPTVAL